MRPLLSLVRTTTLVAAAVLVAGCSSGHGSPIEPGAAGEQTTPSVALEPALDHVHGAVVSAGQLLLGTHSGLVEVDPRTGATQPRGAARDDLMGLAAQGATLVASGHPGSGSDLPDPLGLLRSDDSGITWQPVSLTGEIDFHGLAMDGARVAGIGTADGVLVSADQGVTWQDIDVPNASSLAWFRGDLWIATEEGLRVWRDGRVTSITQDGEPVLVLAGSDDGSALWAVRSDGTVWRTVDGAAWDQRGAVTALEALAATADTAYAITAQTLTTITSG